MPVTSATTPTTSTDPGVRAKTRAPGLSPLAKEEVAWHMVAHTGGQGTQLHKGAEALGTSLPTIRQLTYLAVTRECLIVSVCLFPASYTTPFPESWVGTEARVPS